MSTSVYLASVGRNIESVPSIARCALETTVGRACDPSFPNAVLTTTAMVLRLAAIPVVPSVRALAPTGACFARRFASVLTIDPPGLVTGSLGVGIAIATGDGWIQCPSVAALGCN